jgi:hypothetical protein
MRAFSRIQLPLVVAIALNGVAPTQAQVSLQSQLTGTWKLTASYEIYADGHKTEFFKNAQGVAEFTPGGTFIFEEMGGDRTPIPGTFPPQPVGPAIAFYATYTVDEQNKTYTYHVQQSTFPQWNGASRTSTITEVSPTVLKVATEVVHDPKGDFVPHLEYERIK